MGSALDIARRTTGSSQSVSYHVHSFFSLFSIKFIPVFLHCLHVLIPASTIFWFLSAPHNIIALSTHSISLCHFKHERNLDRHVRLSWLRVILKFIFLYF